MMADLEMFAHSVVFFLFAVGGYTESQAKLVFKKDPLPELPPQTKVRMAQDVVLECEAGGYPAPTIHWLHNGVRIPLVGLDLFTVVQFQVYCQLNMSLF